MKITQTIFLITFYAFILGATAKLLATAVQTKEAEYTSNPPSNTKSSLKIEIPTNQQVPATPTTCHNDTPLDNSPLADNSQSDSEETQPQTPNGYGIDETSNTNEDLNSMRSMLSQWSSLASTSNVPTHNSSYNINDASLTNIQTSYAFIRNSSSSVGSYPNVHYGYQTMNGNHKKQFLQQRTLVSPPYQAQMGNNTNSLPMQTSPTNTSQNAQDESISPLLFNDTERKRICSISLKSPSLEGVDGLRDSFVCKLGKNAGIISDAIIGTDNTTSAQPNEKADGPNNIANINNDKHEMNAISNSSPITILLAYKNTMPVFFVLLLLAVLYKLSEYINLPHAKIKINWKRRSKF